MRNWNDLFGDEDHILHEADISVVHFARILNSQRLNRVLDWGCGAGRNLAYLARMGFEVSGRDPSNRGINAARELLESERLSAELDVVPPGQLVAPGVYVPNKGPEKGIAHYLASREDMSEFFAAFEVLELSHVSSWLSTLNSDKRLEAHWVVIARKKFERRKLFARR